MLDFANDAKGESHKAFVTARAWRIPLAGDNKLKAHISTPPSQPELDEIELTDALNSGSDCFTLIWVQCQAVSPALEDKLKAWIEGPTVGRAAPVRAGIRTIQVTWTETRALVHCPPEQIQDALDATLRFTELESSLKGLESGTNTILSSLAEHQPWTRAPSMRQRRIHPEVNRMAEMTNGAKVMEMQVQSKIEQLDPTLSATSKRLFAELLEQALVHDRLEIAEQPIQFALDHYEVANSRIIEAKNSFWDKSLSLIIIALLTLEFLALIATGNLQWPGETPGAQTSADSRPAPSVHAPAATPEQPVK